jgi:hypothetical protein
MSTEHFVATLDERVQDLVADGADWTVATLARTLGVARRPVKRALSRLVADGEIHIAPIRAGLGRARVFRYGPAPDVSTKRHARGVPPKAGIRRWPAAYPVIAAAFYAMALAGRLASARRVLA